MTRDRAPHLLYVVNTDWFFLSHRLPLARAAREAGAEVLVATPDTGKADEIRREGLMFVPLPMTRSGISPHTETRTFQSLVSLYRRWKPDLVHHSTVKPVIYGSLASRVTGQAGVVNTVGGLGYIFTASRAARCLRPLVMALFRAALSHPRSVTIFQNPEDRRLMIEKGLVSAEHTVLIRGSGVDCNRFAPSPERTDSPLVVLAGRMLWDKGVAEFVAAADQLRAKNPDVRFALVGSPDEGNPKSIRVSTLESWRRDGVIEWWGHCESMPDVLAQASIVVLPSFYAEGVPKILIEAAASMRPVVATDTPGCREIVRPGVNGLLVPPRDEAALAIAIQTLLNDRDLRRRFGQAGREIAVREFAEEIVIRDTLTVYERLLENRFPRVLGAF